MDKKQIQADTNQRVGSHIPRDGWNVTVFLILANRPAIHPIGTGSLFEIGECRFVVTAAHVLDEAHKHGKTIGISSGQESFVSVHGSWIRSAPPQIGLPEDPFDIAIYRLPSGSVEKLAKKKFLRREDVDFGEQPGTAVFSLFGFPGIWATPSRADNEKVSVKPLEYTTHAYGGNESLNGYNPRYHLLLDSSAEDITWPDGSPAVMKTLDGRAATIAHGLQGMSGCTVWAIGDLETPLDQWHKRNPKVVAVQTGIYQPSEVIRATRWVAVTTLIHEAFPELRPALSLWLPD